jgi:hypothetical protein
MFCGDIPLHRPYIGLIYGRSAFSIRNLLTSHGEKTSLEELERCFEALVGDSAINRASLQGMGMENYGKVARSQVGDGSIPIDTFLVG